MVGRGIQVLPDQGRDPVRVAVAAEFVDQAVADRIHLVHCEPEGGPRGALMRHAPLVVSHGGHNATMRALRQGLPIIGSPPRDPTRPSSSSCSSSGTLDELSR